MDAPISVRELVSTFTRGMAEYPVRGWVLESMATKPTILFLEHRVSFNIAHGPPRTNQVVTFIFANATVLYQLQTKSHQAHIRYFDRQWWNLDQSPNLVDMLPMEMLTAADIENAPRHWNPSIPET